MTPAESAFRDFKHHLSRFIQRRLRNVEDAEDVLQDTFLRVVRNQDKFAAADTPLAWLYTVTQSAIIDHQRKSKRRPDGDDKALATLEAARPKTQLEFNACLEPLLRNMPEIYRAAFEFVDINGGKQTDLATSAGVSHPTARSRVQRARKMLQHQITQCCTIQYDTLNKVMDVNPEKSGDTPCC